MRPLRIFTILLLIVALPRPCHAVVVPGPWDRQIYRSPFVGIVECEVAGLGFGTYRVVESWQGTPAGSRLTIEDSAPEGGATLRLHLCGERYVICATTERVSRVVPEVTWHEYGNTGPLTWREPGADLAVYWPVRLPLKVSRRSYGLDALGFFQGDLAAYRDSVLRRAAWPESICEQVALRGELKWDLSDWLRQSDLDSTFALRERRLLLQLPNLNASQMIAELVELARVYPVQGMSLLCHAAGAAGGASALAILRKIQPAGRADSINLSFAVRYVEEGLSGATAGRRRFDPGPPSPDLVLSSELSALDDSLAPLNERAAVHLILERPDAVTAYLMRKHRAENYPYPKRISDYTFVSYFGWKCPANRSEHLRKLLDSEDPVVRVGAAIYLSFTDSAYAMERLRSQLSSPGFAGLWAGTSLARRGDKAAVDSLLARLGTPSDEYREEVSYQRAQLLALLSNSARSSGLEAPPAADPYLIDERYKESKKLLKGLRKWWGKVQERIVVGDPWLPMFSSQSLD